MSLLHWLKEHFEIIAASMVGVFGAGGIVITQQEHGKKIGSLENKHDEVKEHLTEIKGDIKTLLERTKHL
jgi:hypothetical protein